MPPQRGYATMRRQINNKLDGHLHCWTIQEKCKSLFADRNPNKQIRLDIFMNLQEDDLKHKVHTDSKKEEVSSKFWTDAQTQSSRKHHWGRNYTARLISSKRHRQHYEEKRLKRKTLPASTCSKEKSLSKYNDMSNHHTGQTNGMRHNAKTWWESHPTCLAAKMAVEENHELHNGSLLLWGNKSQTEQCGSKRSEFNIDTAEYYSEQDQCKSSTTMPQRDILPIRYVSSGKYIPYRNGAQKKGKSDTKIKSIHSPSKE